MSKVDNRYRLKPITEKDVINNIVQGGCWCVRGYILNDISKLKVSKAKKAELWDLVDKKKDWASC